jgi:hypothetical protein
LYLLKRVTKLFKKGQKKAMEIRVVNFSALLGDPPLGKPPAAICGDDTTSI